jgi:hypothetical protein
MSKNPSETGKNAGIAARIRDAGTRARAEAEARRTADKPSPSPKEIGGADGPEPTRYGDWERKGVISDF